MTQKLEEPITEGDESTSIKELSILGLNDIPNTATSSGAGARARTGLTATGRAVSMLIVLLVLLGVDAALQCILFRGY